MTSWIIMDLGKATARNYRRSRAIANKVLQQAKDEGEREIIGGMISDCQYVIDTLDRGHEPGSRRSIHRRSREQRTTPWDPLWFQSYASPGSTGSPTTLSDHERYQIEDALSTLSERERQCYVLHYGLCFTIGQISSEIGLSRSSVQTFIERAVKKINSEKESSLFLI
jgi:RNA polymerase sigma factor (sigma-70 family)